MDFLPEMCEKYNEAVSLVLAKKRVNSKFLLTAEEYNKKIQQVHQGEEILKSSGCKKTNTYYRMVCQYDTMVVNVREKLFKPLQNEEENNVLYYVTTAEFVDG